MSNNTANNFGINVFNDATMQQRLPKETYQALQQTVLNGTQLAEEHANVIALSLKEWAIERGATHYTHWFQPLTGVTAEKHDSFTSPTQDGDIITKFRGKELIKGEPDASSFPNGGIRATFEARGYTTWDPTSYAFIKENTLCIPTVFCSYGGEILDQKTPLMKSNNALNKQALRILKLFGSDATHVGSTVGAEQEYFLIDKDVYNKRRDLIFTGRTLIGAKPPKGQELDDHYFGSIKERVAKYMADVDCELAKLGIISKTEHNEVAPAQHELAPSYTNTNNGCDHNQLTMEMLKKVAARHDMVCLLHEKPFAGINGSGKHNNWSMLTDTDVNLLDPGKSPRDNAQFLIMLCAIIKAVDNYQDLLRATVASAGNDHRLGANEAPPAIISMFVGSDIEAVINNIVNDTPLPKVTKGKMNVGIDSLPLIPMDNTDRNRTSPFAFTGNKFEFRMPGSNASIANANIVLNTIVADSLADFADELENATDFNKALNDLIRSTLTKHMRIIFNGDGYAKEWITEAEGRGLLNITNTAAALPYITQAKNVALFERHGVLSSRELHARQEVLQENYFKLITIEGATMVEIAHREVMPAVTRYIGEITNIAFQKNAIALDNTMEVELANNLTLLNKQVAKHVAELEAFMAVELDDITAECMHAHDKVLATMELVRNNIDMLEQMMPRDSWPMPNYGDILYSVH